MAASAKVNKAVDKVKSASSNYNKAKTEPKSLILNSPTKKAIVKTVATQPSVREIFLKDAGIDIRIGKPQKSKFGFHPSNVFTVNVNEKLRGTLSEIANYDNGAIGDADIFLHIDALAKSKDKEAIELLQEAIKHKATWLHIQS